MKTLSKTYLFSKTKAEQFQNDVKQLDFLGSDRINIADIEDDLKLINKRYSYAMKLKVIDAVEKGKIIPIYPNINMTKLIPIFLVKNSQINDISAILNLKLYGLKDRNGVFSMETKKMYALLECAYIERELMINQNAFIMNTKIMMLSTQIYVKLFNKVLDKMFGVNLSADVSDQINYLIGKFFLINIIERPENDTLDNIAFSACFNDPNKQRILALNDEFDRTNFNSLEEFITGLSDQFNILTNLNLRSFLNNFMTMFGETSAFAIECYPNLLENIFLGAVFGCRINKDFMFDSVVGKETNSLHSELSRLIV